jgi:prophage regulatory protein
MEYHAVLPGMLAESASIAIYPMPYKMFQLITADGAVKIVLSKQADVDGSQNEWTRSKEIALVRAQKVWVRAVLSDPDLRKKGIRFSRRHRHRLIAEGKFPAPVKLGDATNAWVESEIDAWLETKIVERDQKLKS